LIRSLYYHVLYDEWLKYVESFFKSDGKNMLISISRLKIQMENLQRSSNKLTQTMYQPPYFALAATLDSYEGTRNGGEISFHRFKSSVLWHDSVQAELQLLANSPGLI
jgi:hypothetical protein